MNGILTRSFRALHGSKVSQFSGIPGPDPVLPFGTVGDFLGKRQPWEVCAAYASEYGPMTLIWMGGMPALVLNDPDLICEVLVTNAGEYYKKDPCKALLPIVTENTAFLANGLDWTQARSKEPLKMVEMEAWLPTQVAPLRSEIGRHAAQLAAQPRPVNVGAALQRLSFDAFAVAMCGAVLGDQTYSDFVTMAAVGTRRMQSPLPVPAEPLGPWFRAARRRYYAKYEALVQSASNDGDHGRNDLLAEVLRHKRNLPLDVVRNIIGNQPYGGVFSACSAIATTLFLLHEHPAVTERLDAEVQTLFAQPDWQMADLEACQYLDCVVREALRHWTPVPLYFRNVLPDRAVQLGGVSVPADTTLIITNWALHRSPEHWEDPDRFDPDRWEDGGAEANPFGSGYFFPFGRGDRSCPGQAFALFFIKLALATLSGQMRITFNTNQEYKQTFFFGCMMPRLMGRFTTR